MYNAGMARKQQLSDQLRQAVLRCGKTRYRIGVETGIAHSIISRFINHGAGMSLSSIDKLCECIGAELVLTTKPTRRPKRRSR